VAKRSSRLRHWIARQLDRLPGQCWADLVFWSNGDTPRSTPWSPLSPGCKQDYVRLGTCYCGKLRDDTDPGKAVLRTQVRQHGPNRPGAHSG
jgi:hypothetical protein